MSILSARALSVTPPGAEQASLRGITLHVEPGEWVGLEGPNGSGKTSLLLGLAGLWPAEGDLLLEGASFGPDSEPAARRSVAVIQQDPSSQILQPTVYDELAFAVRNLGLEEGEIEARIATWAERLGLGPELRRDPGLLSAGRQQMVLLGAALVASPKLLLADEPAAHLDDSSRGRVIGILRTEVERGLSIVWATQSSDELAAVDRVVRLGERAAGHGQRCTVRPVTPGEKRLHVRLTPSGHSHGAGAGPEVRIGQPLDLEVGRNGMLGLVGPNGAGKSVILSAIAGLTPCPQVVVEWLEPREPPPIMAMQFPELQIFEEEVSDEIAYASMARGVPRAQALDQASKWLRKLDFDPERFLGQQTWSLSMGAKRIMEVIAALTAPASVALLDEPSAGLDPDRRARLKDVLCEVAQARPIILASHDREWLDDMGIGVNEISPNTSAKSPANLKTN